MSALPAPLSRYRFTNADVRAMAQAGLLRAPERLELIEGELVEMPGDGARHRDWSYALGQWLSNRLGSGHVILPGATLELSAHNGPAPDWYVFPAGLETEAVKGPDVLLAIEQADSSLAYDLGLKANLYARHGVRDYWVIDLARRIVHVHRDPTPEGYGWKRRVMANEPIEALLLPEFSLRLDALPRVGAG